MCCNFGRTYSKEDCLTYWAVEDETWMLYSSQRTKQENTVVRSTLTNRKTMLLVTFTGDGKVYIEYCEPGKTVTSSVYIDFIKALGNKWHVLRSSPTKFSELWWQQNNARPHTASDTTAFLEWRRVTVVRQAP